MAAHIGIEDVARYAGVSISTVSRVMNNHPDVSQKTREKVMAVIKEHAYVPNNSARNLKRESMHAVGLIIKGFANPFFTPMLEVIETELTKHRYLALLHPVQPDDDEISSAISLNKEKKPEGLIFLGGNFEHTREKMAMLDIPFVMVTITMHEHVNRNRCSSITVDDYKEGYDVGARVCNAGHKKVAVIGHSLDDRSISRLRLSGFRKAHEESGCAPEGLYVDYAGSYDMAAGYEAAKRLLARHEFTCLFCVSDTLALGAKRAIYESGKRTPQDVSVIGFDGIDAARYSTPSLATVRQPSEQMARQSVRMLLDNMEFGVPHQHCIAPAEFVEGESFRPLV